MVGDPKTGLMSYPAGSDEMFKALQEMLGADSIGQMQEILGLTKHQFYRLKNQGLVPHEEINKFCIENGKSIDEFFWGSQAGDGMMLELDGELIRVRPSSITLGTVLSDSDLAWLSENAPQRGNSPLHGVYLMKDPLGSAGRTDLPGSLIVQLTDRSRGVEGYAERDRVVVLVREQLVVRLLHPTTKGFCLVTEGGAVVESYDSANESEAPVIIGKVLSSMKNFGRVIVSEDSSGGILG